MTWVLQIFDGDLAQTGTGSSAIADEPVRRAAWRQTAKF